MNEIYRITRIREAYVHVLAGSLAEAEELSNDRSLFSDVDDVNTETYAQREDLDELDKYDYVWDEVEQEWMSPEELKANSKGHA